MAFFRFDPSGNGDEGLGPPPGPFRFRTRRRWRLPGGATRWVVAAVVLILLFVVASIAKGIYADWLWFQSVDYQSVYRLRITTRIWLFFAGAGVFVAFFGANIVVALRAVARDGFRLSSVLGDAEPANARRLALVGGTALVLFLGVVFGSQAAGQWNNVLLYMNSESFGVKDPLFDKDIGFYVFRLPLLNFIVGWSLGVAIVTTIAVAAVYAFRMVVAGFSHGTPSLARPHVSLLIVAVIGLFVWRYWLHRFALVYSERATTFGAAYTDVHAVLPVTYVLMGLGSLTALLVLAAAFRRGLVLLPIGATVLWVVAAIAGGSIYPASMQRFQVEPNELARERTYIARNIGATRAAYGLDQVDERDYPARASITADEIAANPDTIKNIRLWDHRPLRDTLGQVQTIRPLYTFINVDVDRYVIDGELRQVMLAARELNGNNLPADAQSWVNRRLQFTHGFGLAMVAVNEVVQEGLPDFFVKDIPPSGVIDIEQPRIYYGEQPEHYVIVNGKEEEFDYPLGEERTTTAFEGKGGVKLSSYWRRLTYAWEFADTNLLISDAIDGDSRLLYRRNIRERVHQIAPFLRLDSDPYLVAADGQLYWMIDAYTTTDRYPYATRAAGLNYIRNSVKVVVNAYDGSVTFYVIQPDEPLIRAYDRIYPDLFTPFEQMPLALRAHIRYPEDLFRIQVELYRRYHIKDASIFFNKEDIWDIPTELFGDQEQLIEPYYVIMRIPGETREEFALILPFNPANRQNTIAWLAARSDGANYGKLLAFRFPTDTTVFGPAQVEARINQDEDISAQLTLWDQAGSRVIRGNLLMIPIGEGNLYVEPIYLQATSRPFPELKRVVVANGSAIAMEPTLGRALEVVLGRAPPSEPTVGEPTPAAGETPQPGVTPSPTPTPQPTSELPDDVDQLIRDANDAFERAQQALRDGDFARYGRELDQLQQILQRLSELTGG